MGDIGDYWRENKEYKHRRSMGMSERQYERFQQEIARQRKAAKLARCTIECECGKWLPGPNDHRQHVLSRGKKGHAVKTVREVPSDETDWSGF